MTIHEIHSGWFHFRTLQRRDTPDVFVVLLPDGTVVELRFFAFAK